MTTDEIILKIKNGGNERAEGARLLMEHFHRPFIRFFILKGLGSHEADDVFQDVIIKIIKGINSYSSENKGEAWLWQIARNGLLDYQRKKFRESKFIAPVETEEDWSRLSDTKPVENSSGAEESVESCVLNGIKQFKEKEPDRAVAILMQMNKKSISEISAAIGRSVGATKEYLSQCRKKLAPYLVDCHDLMRAQI